MLTLLGYTVVLAVLSFLTTKAFTGTLRAAGTAYWAGWIMLAVCTVYAEWRGLAPPVDDDAITMVAAAHAAAFVAFLAGSALASGTKRHSLRYPIQSLVDSERLVRRFLRPWLGTLALAGLVHLIQQVLFVGVSLSGLMTDLRVSYLETQSLSIAGRIYSYLVTSVGLLLVLFARSDRLYGIRLKRIALLVLSMAFGGFALGGRGFLIAPVFTYIAAYLMMPKIASGVRGSWTTLTRKIVLYLAAAVIVFAALGELRWGLDRFSEDVPFYVRVVDNPAAWIATSMRGITPFVNTFSSLEAHGRVFGEWPVVQLERLGLLSGDTQRDLIDVRAAVLSSYGDPANFPPTIIPFLYGDWGSSGWLIAYFVICLVSQFLTLSLDVSKFPAHLLSTLLVMAMFYTIQAALFFSANNCVALIWLGVFYLILIATRPQKSLVRNVLPQRNVLFSLDPDRLPKSK